VVLGSASWYSTQTPHRSHIVSHVGFKRPPVLATMTVSRSRTSAASVLCVAAVYAAAAGVAFVSAAVEAQASATVTRVSLDGTWALRQSGGCVSDSLAMLCCGSQNTIDAGHAEPNSSHTLTHTRSTFIVRSPRTPTHCRSWLPPRGTRNLPGVSFKPCSANVPGSVPDALYNSDQTGDPTYVQTSSAWMRTSSPCTHV
jgi:hypothetical protein